MRPRSNQPGRFPAKVHKFEYIEDISLDNPKLCPIIRR